MTKDKTRFAPLKKSLSFQTLKKRVNQHFLNNHQSRYANKTMVVKTVLLRSAYIAPYVLLLVFTPPFAASFLPWLLMGAGISGIGMSVMHAVNYRAFV